MPHKISQASMPGKRDDLRVRKTWSLGEGVLEVMEMGDWSL